MKEISKAYNIAYHKKMFVSVILLYCNHVNSSYCTVFIAIVQMPRCQKVHKINVLN